MTVDQASHYDTRAEIYNSQNEMAKRAERLKIMDAHYLAKLTNLLKPGGITYLDFGCATGAHTKQFTVGLQNNTIQKGYAIDISSKMVELATKELPEFQVIQGGADRITFENQLDLITSFFHVLGHLTEAEIELFFQNASRALKPGGVLCFDVIKDIGSLKKILLNKSISERHNKYLVYHSKSPSGSMVKDSENKPLVGSIRMFSREEIQKLAQKNNFAIVDISIPKLPTQDEFAVILRKINR
jgi:SAM-dependent methyltransferase